MRERELREHATCSACGQKIGHTGVPLFATVTVNRYMVNMRALQRQQGLTMMLGGEAVLAQVMGPDEDMAKVLNTSELTLCSDCVMKPQDLSELIATDDESGVKPLSDAPR